MKNKLIDSFLDKLHDNNTSYIEYTKIYYRPPKFKCIIGFIISLGFLLILLSGAVLTSLLFWIVSIVDLIILVYYSLNLFTKNGFLIPKYVVLPKEDIEEDIEEENNIEEDSYDDSEEE